jgi:hypothetical protein
MGHTKLFGALAAACGILGLAGCGGTAGPARTSSNAATSPSAPTPTADLTAAASSTYLAAYNVMATAENLDIPKQNKASTDAAGATAALNDRVSVRQAFDTAVGAITFPDADKADVAAVLNADSSLESALGTLAVNTDSIPNFNLLFPTVVTAENAFRSADAALSRDLNLSG